LLLEAPEHGVVAQWLDVANIVLAESFVARLDRVFPRKLFVSFLLQRWPIQAIRILPEKGFVARFVRKPCCAEASSPDWRARRKISSSAVGLAHAFKPSWEIPRLCRGGSRSLTITGVHR